MNLTGENAVIWKYPGWKTYTLGRMVLVDGLRLLTEADSEWWAQHEDVVCCSDLTFTDPYNYAH